MSSPHNETMISLCLVSPQQTAKVIEKFSGKEGRKERKEGGEGREGGKYDGEQETGLNSRVLMVISDWLLMSKLSVSPVMLMELQQVARRSSVTRALSGRLTL